MPGSSWRSRDDGNITLLSLGFMIVVLVTILVVAAASQVHLQRLRLTNLADELALEAADTVDGGSYYAGGVATLRLDEEAMADAVLARLAADGREWAGDVRVMDVASPDGSTAQVTVAIEVTPLVSGTVLGVDLPGVAVTATGSARAG